MYRYEADSNGSLEFKSCDGLRLPPKFKHVSAGKYNQHFARLPNLMTLHHSHNFGSNCRYSETFHLVYTMKNSVSTHVGKTRKNLAYTEDSMKSCLLTWCMCTDPSETLDSVIDAEMHKTNKTNPVNKSTLYRQFKSKIDINGGSTSLKEIQASVREFVRASRPSNPCDSAMAAFKEKALAVVDALSDKKESNKKARLKKLHEDNCVLNANEEAYLVQLCKILAQSGHGLDHDGVTLCVNLITDSQKSLSKHAVDDFFKRNPGTKFIGSSGIDPLRASQANEHVRDSFFCKLDAFIEILHEMGKMKWKTFSDIPSRLIYNMDELASDTTKHRNKVAADSTSDLRTFTITPEGDRMPFHVTICLTTRADGQYVSDGGVKEGAPPPVIIHAKPAKATTSIVDPTKLGKGILPGLVLLGGCATIEEAYQKNNDLGFLVLATPNGSMKQVTMKPYAEHFVANLSENRDPLEGIILLLDGHSSRWDIPALLHFYKHNVFPFFLPSHTSIWSQANDNGPNKRLHTLIEAATKTRRKGRCIDAKKFKQEDWNFSFVESWRQFLQQERDDFRSKGSNTATNAYLKTGIYPFNPRCPSWANSIANLGISSVAQNQRFQSSFEIRMVPGGAAKLTDLERELLMSGCPDSSMVEEAGARTIRAVVQRLKPVLARWRDRYEADREKLLLSIQESGELFSDSGTRAGNNSELNCTQKALLHALQSLLPQHFVITEAENIALKVAVFKLNDIDTLSTSSPVESKKEKQMKYVKTVLDQTPVCQTVVVETLVDESGNIEAYRGTATKVGNDLWTVTTPDGNGNIVRRDVSTQDLVNSESYRVLAASLSLPATEGQKHCQRSSEKRERSATEKRRQEMAEQEAKDRRAIMVRKEYEHIVRINESGRSLTFTEFLAMEKKLTDSFECEVIVEGQTMLAFANHHKEGSLNLTLHNLLVEKLFSNKRQSEDTSPDSANPRKRQNIGRYVPTKNSEDGISAVEILEAKDLRAKEVTRGKNMKTLERELGVQEKFRDEVKRFQQKKERDFFLVQNSTIKTHISLIYRLFGGDKHSTTKVPDMKAYLKPLRIDAQTSSERIDALDETILAKKAELASIKATMTEQMDDTEGEDLAEPAH